MFFQPIGVKRKSDIVSGNVEKKFKLTTVEFKIPQQHENKNVPKSTRQNKNSRHDLVSKATNNLGLMNKIKTVYPDARYKKFTDVNANSTLESEWGPSGILVLFYQNIGTNMGHFVALFRQDDCANYFDSCGRGLEFEDPQHSPLFMVIKKSKFNFNYNNYQFQRPKLNARLLQQYPDSNILTCGHWVYDRLLCRKYSNLQFKFQYITLLKDRDTIVGIKFSELTHKEKTIQLKKIYDKLIRKFVLKLFKTHDPIYKLKINNLKHRFNIIRRIMM